MRASHCSDGTQTSRWCECINKIKHGLNVPEIFICLLPFQRCVTLHRTRISNARHHIMPGITVHRLKTTKGPQAIAPLLPLAGPDKCKRLSEKGHQFQIYSEPSMQMNPATSTLDGRRLRLTATIVRAVDLQVVGSYTDNSCDSITPRFAQKLNSTIKHLLLKHWHLENKNSTIANKFLHPREVVF